MKIETNAVVRDYLKEHPCIDCGETDSIVLEFDHRDRAAKLFDISQAQHRRSIARLVAEIAKCDVRCANCHRRKTYYEDMAAEMSRLPPSIKEANQ